MMCLFGFGWCGVALVGCLTVVVCPFAIVFGLFDVSVDCWFWGVGGLIW